MTTIRLAVRHSDKQVCAGIAARLRNAVAEPIADPSEVASHFQAVMLGNVDEWSVVERLLTRGLHVLIAANPCPPREIISSCFDRAQQSNVELAVENPDRYLPSRQLIRAQLTGPLGEPGLVRIHRWESDSSTRSMEVAGLPEPLLRDLDLALWFIGRRAERVYALSRGAGGRDQRFLQIHLGFAAGCMALLDYTNRLPAADGYQSLSVIAANGAADADDHHNMQLVQREGFTRAVRTEEQSGQYAAMAQAFVNRLRGEAVPSATAASWRDVFDVAGAVARSIQSGQPVIMESC